MLTLEQIAAHQALASFAVQYDPAQYVPFRVEAVVRDRIAERDPIHLDAVLAWGLAWALFGPYYPFTWPVVLPLPLAILWEDWQQRPLYAATVFRPVGPVTTDIEAIIRREAPQRWVAQTSSSGRFMGRRAYIPMTVGTRYVAEGIGDVSLVRELLAKVARLGKLRHKGPGELVCWRVTYDEPDVTFSLVRDGRLTRAVPVAAARALGLACAATTTRGGWTPSPAYWHPATWAEIYPPGTPAERIETDAVA